MTVCNLKEGIQTGDDDQSLVALERASSSSSSKAGTVAGTSALRVRSVLASMAPTTKRAPAAANDMVKLPPACALSISETRTRTKAPTPQAENRMP